MLRRTVFYLGLSFVFVSAGACSRETKKLPARHRVRGKVTYNGRPLEGATVTFWPMPVNVGDWRSVRPIAIVEADGSFEPNTYEEKDGAVIGEYALTLIYRASRASPDLFAGRFADPKNPMQTVKVVVGENLLAPIELKGPEIVMPAPRNESGQ